MPFDAPQNFMSGLGFGASLVRHADQNRLAQEEESRQQAMLPMKLQQMQWQLKNAALDYSMQQEQMADMTAAKEGTIQLAQVMKGIDDYSDPLKVSKAYEVLSRNPAAMKTPLFQELNFRVRAAEHAKRLRDIANIQATARQQAAQTASQARIDAANTLAASRKATAYSGEPVEKVLSTGETAVYMPGSKSVQILHKDFSPTDKATLASLTIGLRSANQRYNSAISKDASKEEIARHAASVKAHQDAFDKFIKERGIKSRSVSSQASQEEDFGDMFDAQDEALLNATDEDAPEIPGQTPTSQPPVIEDPLGYFKQ